MQGENKRKTGTFYEEMAARYLESKDIRFWTEIITAGRRS